MAISSGKHTSRRKQTDRKKGRLAPRLVVLGLLVIILAFFMHRRWQAQQSVTRALALFESAASANNPGEQRRIYAQIIDTYGGQKDDDSRLAVAGATLNLAILTPDKTEKLAIVDPLIAEHRGHITSNSNISNLIACIMNLRAEYTSDPAEKRERSDEVIAKFRTSRLPATQAEVVRAYLHKAEETVDIAEKLRLLDEGVSLYNIDADDELQAMAVTCLTFKAAAIEDPAEKNAVLDAVIERFGRSGNAATKQQVAWAMRHKGRNSEDPKDRLDGFDSVIEKYGKDPDPSLRKTAKRAVSDKLELTESLPDADERLAGIAAAAGRAGDEQTAVSALFRKARAAASPAEKLHAYDQIIGEYGESGDDGVLAYVAMAAVAKAELSTDTNEKKALYDTVIAKGPLGTSAGMEFYKAVVARVELTNDEREKREIFNNALALALASSDPMSPGIDIMLDRVTRLLNNPEAKMEYYDKVIAADRGDGSTASAMRSKAIHTRDRRERRRLNEEIVSRFGKSGDVRVLLSVASSYKALADDEKDVAEKNRIYDEMIEKFSIPLEGNYARSYVRRFAVEALLAKAAIAPGREEKIKLYNRLIEEYGNDRTGDLRKYVEQAVAAKAVLADGSEK